MGINNTLKGRAIFLDRDGVINRAIVRGNRPYPPSKISELEIIPGVPEALYRFRAAGYKLIVITNQPDVARGIQTREMVEAIHMVLQKQLPLDEFRICYHDDVDKCKCRKPSPGLLLEAAHDAHLDIASCFMIGDRWRDIEAGCRAGCRTVFINYNYDETQPKGYSISVRSLIEGADWILSQHYNRGG